MVPSLCEDTATTMAYIEHTRAHIPNYNQGRAVCYRTALIAISKKPGQPSTGAQAAGSLAPLLTALARGAES